MPYFGITTLKPVGGRYKASSIQGTFLVRINKIPVKKNVARGVEQLLIELNNSGKPYPLKSNDIDNIKNSTSPKRIHWYNFRKKSGLKWLNSNYPDWKERFNVKSSNFDENYKSKVEQHIKKF